MYRIFISNIPEGLSKILLYELLVNFAPLKSFFYKENFSYAEYFTIEDMEYSIKMVNGLKIMGKRIKARRSNKEATYSITIEGTSHHTEGTSMEEEIKNVLSKFGSCKVTGKTAIFRNEESGEKAKESLKKNKIGGARIILTRILD